MLRSSESETEILLGNKQLLGIFLVVAILLGVSFTGGYLLGRGGTGKGAKAQVEKASGSSDGAAGPAGSGGQTHTVGGEATLPAAASGGADAEAAAPASRTSNNGTDDNVKVSQPILGARKHGSSPVPVPVQKVAVMEPETSSTSSDGYTPRSGSEYLQVAAVSRDEAEAVADVLQKKGFRAHAVPKPGNAKLYRVIIGPVKDAGDLASTRDALRSKAGFREVIVQHY